MPVTSKLWFLLDRDLRRAALGLFGLMLAGVCLETLGVGLVIPALGLMMHQDPLLKYPAIAAWLSHIGSPPREQLVTFGMLFLVGVYAVKALFLALLAWRQARFIGQLQASLGRRLFEGYLRQPYPFHLQRNSAQLLHVTIDQSSSFAAVFQQGLVLLTEVLVVIGIATMLVVVEPVGALTVVSVLALAAWIFLHITRMHTARWGVSLHHHERARLQIAQEALGGIKEVLVLGREHAFCERFVHHNASSAGAVERHSTLLALPRMWLELLAVTGLAGLVLVMLGAGRPIEALLPAVALFAAAAFRLIPSVNRILASIQAMRFGLPAINTLHDEISLIEEQAAAGSQSVPGTALTLTRELQLERVSFSYPGSTKPALDDITLSIPQGASAGFVGGSGAGKSTLVDVILGLLKPERGVLHIDGIDLHTGLRGWQDQIGYVPQSIFLSDDTLRRNVAFGLADDEINEDAVRRALHAAQLDGLVDELPEGLDSKVGERGVRLSGGQRQRIGIARALYHDPAILVLDEATSSLDTETEHEVMSAVRALQGRKTVLIVAHRLSTVAHCNPVFRLDRGRIVERGSFAAVTGASSVATALQS